MAAVVKRHNDRDTGNEHWWFFCPGCKCHHYFELPRWTFVNKDLDKPTFTPSLKYEDPTGEGKVLCHLVMTDGVINFCADCAHGLAGQSVPCPEYDRG